MYEKRTAEILEAVLQKVAREIYNTYIIHLDEKSITIDSVYETIKDIPDTLRCTHIFEKGTKKDQLCNVVLCTNHKPPKLSDITDEVLVNLLNMSILEANVEESRRELGLPALSK
jgi:hypothetical protein